MIRGPSFGGAKGGIVWDPVSEDRERIIRTYARSLRHLVPEKYVCGLDMGLSEADAALVIDELCDKPYLHGQAVIIECQGAGLGTSRQGWPQIRPYRACKNSIAGQMSNAIHGFKLGKGLTDGIGLAKEISNHKFDQILNLKKDQK